MHVEVYSKFDNVPEEVILPKQCHGDQIIEIVTGKENLNNCDALVTKNKSKLLGIRTADCGAVCFSDGDKIGIAHIGWCGLCLGLIEKMLRNFNKGGLKIFVGPFNHSFEIKKDFCYDEIKAKFGDQFFIESNGKVTF